MTSTPRRTDAELTTAVDQELDRVPGVDTSRVGVPGPGDAVVAHRLHVLG